MRTTIYDIVCCCDINLFLGAILAIKINDLQFFVMLAVFTYQDNESLMMQGSDQWNPVFSLKDFCQLGLN